MKKLFLLLGIILFSQSLKADGVLIVDAVQGIYLKLINSEINVDVNNQVGLIRSDQLFVNNTGGAVVVKYGFPMPESGAATQLRWRVGDTWSYASFSASEQDTTLPGGGGDPIDPNLKTFLGDTPLYFNINDTIQNNDTLEIELSYVQLLAYRFNKVTFEYPSDYSLIQSSVIDLTQSINFHLYSERTITSVEMDYYDPVITNDGNIADLSLIVYESTSVENYRIIYELASDELGIISFSTYLPDSLSTCDSLGNGFVGLIIEPESNENTDVLEKVFTLIIDKSGSMLGNKIVQAKEAATFIVNNLNEGDYFNIISFNDEVQSFKNEHVAFNITNQNDALNFISAIEAEGWTNISDALTDAIDQFTAVDTSKANIIIFFTDGEATAGETSTQGILDNVEDAINFNETQIFLFTFGIGMSVNEQLLTLLALNNQGLAEFITDQEVESVISDFYLTIRNPVLLNTQIVFSPDIISELYPDPLPNLYKGMQLILTGRYDIAQDVSVTLNGNAFGNDVSYTYEFGLSDSLNEGFMFLPKLWAKSKIENLTFLYYSLPENSEQSDSVISVIEQISICYQVLSIFTSFEDDDGTTEVQELLNETEEFGLKFYPSPFVTETSVVVELNAAKTILLNIYDINGRLIKQIKTEGVIGKNIISWNGTNSSNQQVSSGIYFYRISIDDKSYFGKIVKE